MELGVHPNEAEIFPESLAGRVLALGGKSPTTRIPHHARWNQRASLTHPTFSLVSGLSDTWDTSVSRIFPCDLRPVGDTILHMLDMDDLICPSCRQTGRLIVLHRDGGTGLVLARCCEDVEYGHTCGQPILWHGSAFGNEIHRVIYPPMLNAPADPAIPESLAFSLTEDRLCHDAGLVGTEWTPRELRHSFVSLLSDHEIPLENISRLVGHTTPW